MKSERDYRGHLALLLANIIWGVNNPLSKTLMPAWVDSYALTFFRMAGAALVFWITSFFLKKEKVPVKDIFLLFFASLFGVVLNQGLFLFGLSRTSSIDAAIVATTVPIITMIASAIYLKEPITGKKAIGVLIGAAGAILLIVTSSAARNGGSGNTLGNLLCLLASISFSLYLTLFKRVITSYAPVTVMKWLFLFAAVISAPVCFPAVTQPDYSRFPVSVFLRIGFVVLAATYLAYLLMPVGQKLLRPTTVSMYNYVQPLVASTVAVFIGLDTFGVYKVVAGVLVFLGVYIVTRSKSREQVLEEQKMREAKG